MERNEPVPTCWVVRGFKKFKFINDILGYEEEE